VNVAVGFAQLVRLSRLKNLYPELPADFFSEIGIFLKTENDQITEADIQTIEARRAQIAETSPLPAWAKRPRD